MYRVTGYPVNINEALQLAKKMKVNSSIYYAEGIYIVVYTIGLTFGKNAKVNLRRSYNDCINIRDYMYNNGNVRTYIESVTKDTVLKKTAAGRVYLYCAEDEYDEIMNRYFLVTVGKPKDLNYRGF